MIKFFARGRCAQALADNPVTTGSVGIPVQFSFSQEWDALQKIAVFRAGDAAVDVALTGDTTTVPADVLTTAGLPLMIGVYGAAADGTIVIPTVWARAETIKAGTAPSGVDPAEPTPSWVAQVQAIAAEALETAEAVQAAAERGDFDGADDVFYADYGTTTSAEIEAAYQAGQACFCKLDTGTVLQLFYPYSAAYHVFSAAYNDTIYVAICNNSSWSKVTRQLAKASDIPTVASDVGAIADPATKSSGQVLTYDGSAWVAQTPSGGGAVDSVNGQTGTVVLTAADVGAGTYSKPSGGIPKTDLASAVQTSLGKADSAYQKPSGGIPATDLASGVIPTVPTKTSDLNNDSGFVNAAGAAAAAPVQSVNGQTGAVSLTIPSSASDVGAVAANQGSGNAGKFMVVGSDGVVAPVAMSAWQGGSF